MTTRIIKTAADLKHYVNEAGHCPHFFTRDTMRFFGDTMANYGVRKATIVAVLGGDDIECYELFRRRPVKNGLQASAYFAVDGFRRVHPTTC